MIKEIAKKNLLLKRIVRTHRLKNKQPLWKGLIAKDKDFWNLAIKNSENGQKILFATSVGSHLGATTLESMLAIALTLRGANTHVLLCDSILPACLACWNEWFPKKEKFVKYGPQKDMCVTCFNPANKMFESLGITVHRYSELLDKDEMDEAENISLKIPFDKVGSFILDGFAVGEHALAGALRFYTRGGLDGQKYAEPVLRRYLKAAIMTVYAMRNLLGKENFSCSVSIHGIYVPHGLIGEVCRKEKKRVVNWNPAYRKKCFIFSHNDTYHHTMITEPLEKWLKLEWDKKIDDKLMEYLKSRWKGTNDWIWFHEKPKFELKDIADRYKIDFSKPCIGMLTNVMWDAQLHYPSNAFSGMLEWVISTIEYFIKRPDLQLIIRIHPAEIRGTLPAEQRIGDEIKKVYPRLPKNIIIIPPESDVSTYAVMLKCSGVIIYNTKTGVELSAMGTPVIVAGEAWIRNKGFAVDANTRKEYFDILNKLPFGNKMSDEKQERAKKYAYHFFFRRMIPLEFMEPTAKEPPYIVNINSLKDLMPGKFKGLDVICEGIMKTTDFIYPDEQTMQQDMEVSKDGSLIV